MDALAQVVLFRSSKQIVLVQLVPIKRRCDVELAGLPLLSLLDIGHGRRKGGGPGAWRFRVWRLVQGVA